MADVPMPEEMIAWMRQRNWGAHHQQWHFVRRWDFWHAMAQRADLPEADRQDIQAMVAEAVANGWTRAAIPEGTTGGGEEFLFMHRAMFHLLAQTFPQHYHTLRGWNSPPQDPSTAEDPVPDDSAPPFAPGMTQAINEIEAAMPGFDSDDTFGLFLETNLRPMPGNPLERSDDARTGLHNYLHNRWSEDGSVINLGDPRVNIFNRRFWKLHGWIDYFWWRFRAAKGADDADASYQDKLNRSIAMMNMGGHHHGVDFEIAEAPPRGRETCSRSTDRRGPWHRSMLPHGPVTPASQR